MRGTSAAVFPQLPSTQSSWVLFSASIGEVKGQIISRHCSAITNHSGQVSPTPRSGQEEANMGTKGKVLSFLSMDSTLTLLPGP